MFISLPISTVKLSNSTENVIVYYGADKITVVWQLVQASVVRILGVHLSFSGSELEYEDMSWEWLLCKYVPKRLNTPS